MYSLASARLQEPDGTFSLKAVGVEATLSEYPSDDSGPDRKKPSTTL
jgi:hypothetical protein